MLIYYLHLTENLSPKMVQYISILEMVLTRIILFKILNNSYVMPIKDFINHAEVNKDAVRAILKTDQDDIVITVEQLKNAYLLFALNGKPLTENGPVHLYFGDGSNKDNPFQNIKQIMIE